MTGFTKRPRAEAGASRPALSPRRCFAGVLAVLMVSSVMVLALPPAPASAQIFTVPRIISITVGADADGQPTLTVATSVPGRGQRAVIQIKPSSVGQFPAKSLDHSLPDGVSRNAALSTANAFFGTRSDVFTGFMKGTKYDVVAHTVLTSNNGFARGKTRLQSVTTWDDPDAPTAFQVAAGDANLTVSWQAPADTGGSGATLTGYDLEYKETSAPDQPAATAGDPSTGWVDAAHAGTATIAEIAGLVNRRGYDVRVRATNAVGHSPWLTGAGTPDPTATRTVSLSKADDPPEGSPISVTATLSAPFAARDVIIPVTVTAPDGLGSLTSITIKSGETTGTGTITTVADLDTEGESATVELGTLPPGVTAGASRSVTVTVEDREFGSSSAGPPPLPGLRVRRMTTADGKGVLGLETESPDASAYSVVIQIKVAGESWPTRTAGDSLPTGVLPGPLVRNIASFRGFTTGTEYVVRSHLVSIGDSTVGTSSSPEFSVTWGVPDAPRGPLESLWSTVLTVDADGGLKGCDNDAGGLDGCSAALVDDSFSFGGASYQVTSLHVEADGDLVMDLDAAGDSLAGFAAFVRVGGNDGMVYPLSLNGNAATWSGGPSWTDDQRVEISIDGYQMAPVVNARDAGLDVLYHSVGDSWATPSDFTGGNQLEKRLPVIGYEVQYKETSAADQAASTPNDPSTGWVVGTAARHPSCVLCWHSVLSGLTNSESHDVRVRARNSLGASSWATASGTPLGVVPEVTSATAGAADGAPTLTVVTVNPDANTYELVVQIKAAEAQWPVPGRSHSLPDGVSRNTAASTDDSHVFTGLARGASYDVRAHLVADQIYGSTAAKRVRTWDVPSAPGAPDDVVWSHTFSVSVSDEDGGVQGCASRFVPLSPCGAGKISYRGETLEVFAIYVEANPRFPPGPPRLNLNFEPENNVPGALNKGRLRLGGVGGVVYPLSKGRQGGNWWYWDNPAPPSWTDGQRVTVELIAPSDHAAVTAGDASLTVGWEAPKITGGPGVAVTGYGVEYKETLAADRAAITAGDPSTGWVDAGHSGTGTSTAITSLTNGTAYDVRVRAENAVGGGPWLTGAGTPVAPPVPGITSVVAGEASGNPIFTVVTTNPDSSTYDVVVQVKTSATDDWPARATSHSLPTGVARTSASTATRHVLTVAKGTAYDVRAHLVAKSDSAVVAASSPESSVTSWDDPGVPTGLVVTAGDKKLGVSWRAPADTGGTGVTLTGYDVEYKESSAADRAATTPGDASTGWVDAGHTGTGTSTAIASLTNGTAYDVRVRARNAVGASSWLSGDGTPEPPVPGITSVTAGAASGSPTLTVVTTNPSPDDHDVVIQIKKSDATWPASRGTSHQLPSGVGHDAAASSAGSDVFTGFEKGAVYNVRAHLKTKGATPTALEASSAATTATTWDVPGALSAPTVTSGVGKLTVNWRAPASAGGTGAAVTGYDVNYKEGSAPDRDAVLWDATLTVDRRDTIFGCESFSLLANCDVALDDDDFSLGDVDYTVRAISINSVNGQLRLITDSDFGDLVDYSLVIDGSSFPFNHELRNFSTAGWGSSLSWSDGQKVRVSLVRKDRSPAAGWVDAGHAGTATTAEIAGLTDGTSYDVRVRARNGISPGSAWAGARGTPEDLPVPVVDSVRVGAAVGGLPFLLVSYSNPDSSRYAVVVQVREGSAGWAARGVGGAGVGLGPGRTYVGTGLKKGTSYGVRAHLVVKSTNSVVGASSAETRVVTWDDPGPPTGLVVAGGDSRLVLSWAAPVDDGGVGLTGYEVAYKAGSAPDRASPGRDPSTGWVDVVPSPATAAATIGGLVKGTSYDVRVRATNPAGQSSWVSGSGVAADRSDASLKSLQVALTDAGGTPVPLTPRRLALGSRFTVRVADDVAEVKVSAAPTAAGAAVTIDGTPGAAKVVALGYGDNTVTVVVTALDGTTAKTYTITAKRAYPVPAVVSVAEGAHSDGTPTATVVTSNPDAAAYTVVVQVKEASAVWPARAAAHSLPAGVSRASSSTADSHVLTGLAKGTAYSVRAHLVTTAATPAVIDDSSSEKAFTAWNVPGAPGGPDAAAWSTTLTVDADGADRGCDNAAGGLDDCADALSSDQFGFGGKTLRVTSLYVGADGNLNLKIATAGDAPAGLRAAKLRIGGTNGVSYPLTKGPGKLYFWTGGPTWTDDQTVTVELLAPSDTPTVTPGDAKLTVGWFAPADPGGRGAAITGYDVAYKESSAADRAAATPGDASTGWVAVAHSGTGTSVEITSLTNAVDYDVRVRAKNAVGGSVWVSGSGRPLPAKYFALSTEAESVGEGGLIRLLVEMSPRPSQEVVVPLLRDGRLFKRVRLTPSNPAAYYVVRTAQNEFVTGDVTYVFSLGGLPDGYGADLGWEVLEGYGEVSVTVVDDDAAALVVSVSPARAQAGEQVTFTGRLLSSRSIEVGRLTADGDAASSVSFHDAASGVTLTFAGSGEDRWLNTAEERTATATWTVPDPVAAPGTSFSFVFKENPGERARLAAKDFSSLPVSVRVAHSEPAKTASLADAQAVEGADLEVVASFAPAVNAGSGLPIPLSFVHGWTSSADLGLRPASFTADPGATSATYTLGTVDDTLVEPDETLAVSFGPNLGHGYNDVSGPATLTITDNDSATLVVSATADGSAVAHGDTVTDLGVALVYSAALSLDGSATAVVPHRSSRDVVLNASVNGRGVGSFRFVDKNRDGLLTGDELKAAGTVAWTTDGRAATLSAVPLGWVTHNINTEDFTVNGRGQTRATGLRASAGDGSATLSWQWPDTAPSVNGWRVRHRDRSDPSGAYTVQTLADPAARSFTFTGLVNGRAYGVQVAPYTDGRALWQGTSLVLPAYAVPTLTSVTAGAVGGKPALTVVTSNPDSAGFDVVVQIKESSGAWPASRAASHQLPDGVSRDAAASSAGSDVFTGFEKGTAYSVRAHLVSKGATPSANPGSSPSVEATTWDVPGALSAPTVTAGVGKLTLSWAAPADPGGTGAAVTGYDVEYKEASAADRAATTPGNPATGWVDAGHAGTATTAEIAGLTDGTSYDVRVRARNGISPGSAWAGARGTPEDLPVPVVDSVRVGAAVGGLPFLLVSYSNPDSSRYAVVVQVREGSAGWAARGVGGAGVGLGPGRTYVGTGLKKGTSYGVRAHLVVKSTNSVVGASSAETRVVTWDDPGPPTGLVVAGGDSRLVLSWAAPVDDGGVGLTGYEVAYKAGSAPDRASPGRDPSTGWVDVVPSPATAAATIGGLVKGTSYDVRVRATNPAGQSSWVSGSGVAADRSDASLKSLQVALTDAGGTPVPLTPRRLALGSRFTVRVADDVAEVKVSAAPTAAGAAVTIDGTPGAAKVVALGYGDNTVTVVVTALDGTTAKTYTITAKRAYPVPAVVSVAEGAHSDGTPTATVVTSNPDAAAYTVVVQVKEASAVWPARAAAHSLPAGVSRASSSTADSHVLTGLAKGTAYSVRAHLVTTAATPAVIDDSSSEKAFTAWNVPGAPGGPDAAAWSTTLTVDADGADRGCDNAAGGLDDCADALSSDQFGFGGKTLRVTSLYVGADGNLNLKIATAGDAPAGLRAAKLRIGGTNGVSYPLTKGPGKLYFWTGGPTWTDDQTVTVELLAPSDTPTVTPGDAKLTVGWFAPADPGGRGAAITGYDVAYKESSAADRAATTAGDPSTGWVDAGHSGTATRAEIAGLTGGTSYDVRVRARNGISPGGAWAAARGTPQAELELAFDAVASEEAAGERGQTVRVTATLTEAAAAETTVALSVDDSSTATRHKDYSWFVPRALTIAVGETSVSTMLTVFDDDIAEDSETIVVDARATRTEEGVARTIRAQRQTLTIEDDDTAGVLLVKLHDAGVTGDDWARDVVTAELRTVTALTVSTVVPRDTYSVRLASEPTADVVIAAASVAPGVAVVSGGPLTFTASDWNRNQTLTVTGVASGATLITHISASSDPKYDGVFIDVAVTVTQGHFVPGVPRDVVAANPNGQQSGQLTVAWRPPADDGGDAVTGYDVEYKESAAEDRAAATPGDPRSGWVDSGHTGSGTTTQITGLDNGASYEIRVRAVNSVGPGEWSASATGTTPEPQEETQPPEETPPEAETPPEETPPEAETPPEETPDAPAEVPGPVTGLALSATEKTVTATWQAPESGGAPDGYIVHLKAVGGGSGKTHRPKAGKLTTTFRNLEPGAAYKVWVRAQNDAGKGERVLARVTLPAAPPG